MSCSARVRSVTDLPLIAYPNAVRAYDADDQDVERSSVVVGRRRRDPSAAAAVSALGR